MFVEVSVSDKKTRIESDSSISSRNCDFVSSSSFEAYSGKFEKSYTLPVTFSLNGLMKVLGTRSCCHGPREKSLVIKG